MSASLPAPNDFASNPPVRRRSPRIKRKRRRMSVTMLSAVAFLVLVALAILVEFGVHLVRADPRDARAIAERELRLNTLQTGERVVREVSVFQRPAISYFRATRGLLVLTNKRLLYLGVEPRDLLANPDLPPTFTERDFAIDTTVHLAAGRTFFGLAKAIVISTSVETLKLGVPSATASSANGMILAMSARYDRAVELASAQRAFLAKTETERKAAEIARRRAKYYTVRRGDALSTIATIWNTTPDRLRAWNHIAGNSIRVGASLLVRPAI